MIITSGILAILLASAVAAPVSEAPESAQAQLDRLQKAARSVRTLHMKSRTRRKSETENFRASTETWLLRNDDGVLMRSEESIRVTDYLSDPVRFINARNIVVVDGEHHWREWEVDRQLQVSRQKSVAREPLAALQEQCKVGEAKVLGHREILGEPCVVMEFIIREGNGQTKTTVWISERAGAVLQMWLQDANGALTRMTATEFTTGVDLDESLFAYTPPAGVAVKESDEIVDAPDVPDLTNETSPPPAASDAADTPARENG